MKSPKDHKIIQIDITNACVHSCSNCTRFCGHHKKPFFMSFDTFKRAVDSLEGHTGMIGLMGGEPTLHPEFERFVEYLDSKIPVEHKARLNEFVYPQRNFVQARDRADHAHSIIHQYADGPRDVICGAGLFSSMNKSFKKYFELIQDHVRYQCLNDHNNAMYHQPVMITRKELGIDDDTFKRLRDKCWIQQLWSSSITPKGAFFCEIAAALDMLFDGPGGWTIEKGWWKREEKDFGDQLGWCELCGIALKTFSRDAREGIDDASPFWEEKLKVLGSPKFNNGKVNIVKINNGIIDEKTMPKGKAITLESGDEPYADVHDDKFNAERSILYPDGFDCLVITKQKNTAGLDEKFHYRDVFDTVSFVSGEEHFGRAFNRVLAELSPDKYLVVITENVFLNPGVMAGLKDCIINPGTLHYIDFYRKQDRCNGYFSNYDSLDSGFAVLLSKNAMALKRLGFDRIANIRGFDEIVRAWEPHKVIRFHPDMEYYPKPYPEKRKNIIVRGLRHLKKHGVILTVKKTLKKAGEKLL
jgi:organic radical activating enzyme